MIIGLCLQKERHPFIVVVLVVVAAGVAKCCYFQRQVKPLSSHWSGNFECKAYCLRESGGQSCYISPALFLKTDKIALLQTNVTGAHRSHYFHKCIRKRKPDIWVHSNIRKHVHLNGVFMLKNPFKYKIYKIHFFFTLVAVKHWNRLSERLTEHNPQQPAVADPLSRGLD